MFVALAVVFALDASVVIKKEPLFAPPLRVDRTEAIHRPSPALWGTGAGVLFLGAVAHVGASADVCRQKDAGCSALAVIPIVGPLAQIRYLGARPVPSGQGLGGAIGSAFAGLYDLAVASLVITSIAEAVGTGLIFAGAFHRTRIPLRDGALTVTVTPAAGGASILGMF